MFYGGIKVGGGRSMSGLPSGLLFARELRRISLGALKRHGCKQVRLSVA